MGLWLKLVNFLLFENVDFFNFKNIVDVGGGDVINLIVLVKVFFDVNIILMDIFDSCKIV